MREVPAIEGRVPPHDLDAEAAVLSAALLDSEARDEVLTVLLPEHFYADANREIWQAIVDMTSRGTTVDVVSVATRLRETGKIQVVGGAKYLGMLVDAIPVGASVLTHAKTVWRKWRRRKAIRVLLKLLGHGYSYDIDDDDFIAEVDKLVTEAISSTFTAEGPKRLQDVLVETMHSISEAAEKGAGHDAIPTPIVKLTEATDGGGRPGNLITIAGRPGHGKSTLADQWSVIAATPREVGMHGWVYASSLEMPGRQKGARMLSNASNVSLSELRTGRLLPDQWAALTEAGERLARLPIWIDEKPASPIRIAAEARKIARRAERAGSRLAMVVVDYLQILDLPKSETRERAVADASAAMKRLAGELQCVVVQLAQLNRKVDHEKVPRPTMAHLKESGAIEADSDIIIFTYRPERYLQFKDDPEMRGFAELLLGKQRDGDDGIIECRFDGAHTRFVDAPESVPPPPPGDHWADYERQADAIGI